FRLAGVTVADGAAVVDGFSDGWGARDWRPSVKVTSAIVGASTTIARAHHGPEMLPAQPNAWSREKRPGLVAVTATAVAMISRLYSKPPAELKKPFFQWTVPIAFSITTVIASAANGVTRPKANSRPPPSSLRPATNAIASGVRKPSPAKNFRVPAGPLPPKE